MSTRTDADAQSPTFPRTRAAKAITTAALTVAAVIDLSSLVDAYVTLTSTVTFSIKGGSTAALVATSNAPTAAFAPHNALQQYSFKVTRDACFVNAIGTGSGTLTYWKSSP